MYLLTTKCVNSSHTLRENPILSKGLKVENIGLHNSERLPQ